MGAREDTAIAGDCTERTERREGEIKTSLCLYALFKKETPVLVPNAMPYTMMYNTP
jgi:hypothetical protein